MEVYPSLAFDSLFENRGSRRTQSILDRVKDQAAGLQPPAGRQRPAQAGRVPDQRARGGEAGGAHARGQGPGRRPGQAPAAAGAQHEAPRQRPARGHPRAHAADVRHRGAGVPDRQDPDRHRCCCAGICRACSIRSWTCATPTTRPRTAISPTTTSACPGSTAARWPTWPSKLAAMPEGEGTVLDHSLPAVPVEHVVRATSTTTASCRWSPSAAWAARWRPAACSTTGTRATTTASICSLYLSLMDRMGVKLDRFGDADRRLAERLMVRSHAPATGAGPPRDTLRPSDRSPRSTRANAKRSVRVEPHRDSETTDGVFALAGASGRAAG